MTLERFIILDSILDKPGNLTNEEFVIIKTYAEVEYQMFRTPAKYSDLAIHDLPHES